MRYLLLLTVFLAACTTAVPVKRNFPAADPAMFEPAPKLATIPPDTQDLDKLIANSADNYGKYRELVQRLEMWKEWYTKQKENFDSVK